MAAKSVADLTTDNTNDIASASLPDSINPTLDAQRRKDLIDSMYNKIDGILISALRALTIPTWATGKINTSGDQLETVIQKIIDEIQAIYDIFNNTSGLMTPQGRPGLFLAITDPEVVQTFRLANSTPTDLSNLILSNDSTKGAFDNGNNWSTFNYKVPTSPSSPQKFSLTGIEVELLEFNQVSTDPISIYAEIRKNGTVVSGGTSVGASFISGTNNVGDKKYISDLLTAAITVVAGDVISVMMCCNNGLTHSATGTVRINSATFSNQD